MADFIPVNEGDLSPPMILLFLLMIAASCSPGEYPARAGLVPENGRGKYVLVDESGIGGGVGV
jgi:hypothetical protein